jgi:hypothetical protein
VGFAGALLGQRFLLILSGVGIVAGFMFSRVLPRTLGPTGPGRSPARGLGTIVLVVLGAMSTVLAVLGLLWLGLHLRREALKDFERAVLDRRLGESNSGSIRPWLNGVLLLVVAGGIWRVARALTVPTSRSLRARDTRPPILFLRGFVDDDIRIYARRSRRHSWLARLSLRRNERFEEIVAWTLGAYGPVVAIAQPRRRRRRSGASRELVRTEDWMSVVRDRMHDAAAIVLVVGITEGLAAETRALAELGHLQRTLLVLPPMGGKQVARRWQTIAHQIGVWCPIEQRDKGVVAVRVHEGRTIFYRGRKRNDVTSEAAIEVALSDMTSSAIAATSPLASGLPPESGRVADR